MLTLVAGKKKGTIIDCKIECKRKLVSPEEAVKEIKSFDIVTLGHTSTAPYSLCQALGKRKDELEGVRINTRDIANLSMKGGAYGTIRRRD